MNDITNSQIVSLRDEASRAGDFVQVGICNVALGESRDLDRAVAQGILDQDDADYIATLDAAAARAECARVVAHAAAQ